jgi:hypothetical protein
LPGTSSNGRHGTGNKPRYYIYDLGEHLILENTYFLFVDQPYKYLPSSARKHDPKAVNEGKAYVDQWDDNHVRMPCSVKFVDVSRTHSYLFLKICVVNKEK